MQVPSAFRADPASGGPGCRARGYPGRMPATRWAGCPRRAAPGRMPAPGGPGPGGPGAVLLCPDNGFSVPDGQRAAPSWPTSVTRTTAAPASSEAARSISALMPQS